MEKKFGATKGRPRCQNGTGTHYNACRTRMLSSMTSQTSVAPPASAADMAVDRQEPEAGGEKRSHEDRGRDAVMGVADDLQGQASNSSSRNKVRAARFAGSRGLRLGPPSRNQVLTKKSKSGAEEVALERKERFEARVSTAAQGRQGAGGPMLGDLSPAKPVYGTKSGQSWTRTPWKQGARKSCVALDEQEGDHPGCRTIFPAWSETHQEQVALNHHTAGGADVKSRMVAAEGGIRKQG